MYAPIKAPCFITACFINPCFIPPFFINPCFINPVHVLPIQSSPYFITSYIIDAQGRCRAFCQQQETTDCKQSLHDGASGLETNSANIKLPKIPLPKFTCQSPIEWVRFWDQFTTAVDENQSLHDVQKLAFLKSFLLGPAAESIQGYKLTEDYYSLVV